MGKVFDALDEEAVAFLNDQHVFFVATAPREGRVNLSPKGYDTFRVIDPTTVAYLDLTGSGVETIAHLKDDGRVTFLFCAFEGPPKLIRLYGRGEVVLPTHPDFDALRARFGERQGQKGVRSVIRVALDEVRTACGYSVPIMPFEREREVLRDYYDRKGEDGMAEYRAEKNRESIDGLPALDDESA